MARSWRWTDRPASRGASPTGCGCTSSTTSTPSANGAAPSRSPTSRHPRQSSRGTRTCPYLPLIATFGDAERSSLSPTENAALDLLAGWDQKHYGPGIDIADPGARDGPAATVFGAFVEAIRDELFADLKDLVIDPADGM